MDGNKKNKVRLFFYWGILLGIVWFFLEVVGYLGLWWNSRSVDYLSNKNDFQIRRMLMGDENPETLPRCLSMPHLGYVHTPLYRKAGIQQHNEDGYRGRRVPLHKNGKFRILCLGGSTTYGSGVVSPEETYPARLEALLSDYISRDSLQRGRYTGAEVINAGLEAGNSAEELQQYLFKYRYYKPDLVIVHSGVNDASLLANAPSDFQLDYTHHRRLNFHLEPLPQPTRTLFRSYFFSWVSIQLFYRNFSNKGDEFMHQSQQRYIRWSNVNADSVLAARDGERYPFYHNMRSLYAEILGDSATLLVLPNVLNKNSAQVRSNPKYTDASEWNIALTRQLAREMGGIYVPFTFDSISRAESWLDDCHLDAAGEQEKAAVVFPHVVNALTARNPK